MSEPVPFPQAQKLIRGYVCSGCWGTLYISQGLPDQMAIVWCANCKDETPGYVSMSYVERRRAESFHERMEAEKVLSEALHLPKKTYADVLKELGY